MPIVLFIIYKITLHNSNFLVIYKYTYILNAFINTLAVLHVITGLECTVKKRIYKLSFILDVLIMMLILLNLFLA